MATKCQYSIPTASRVDECPLSKEQWDQRAQKKMCWYINSTCDNKPLEYHCLSNAFQNESIEVCAPKTRLASGFCPSFSFGGARITDQYNCLNNVSNGCPTEQYFSNVIYSYPICLQKKISIDDGLQLTTDGSQLTIGATTSAVLPSGSRVEDSCPGCLPCIFLLILIFVLLIISVGLCGYFLYELLRSGQDFIGKRCFRTIFSCPCVQVRRKDVKSTYGSRVNSQEKLEKSSLISETRILILGETGSGKSSTGNTILGANKFLAEFSPQPVTQLCQTQQVERDNECISVVDTPGVYETSDSSKGYYEHITDMERYTGPGPHVILFVLSPTSFKTGIKALQFIETIFGRDIFEYCILLITKEDDFKREGKTLESFLSRAPPEIHEKRRLCKKREIAFENVTYDQTYREEKVNELMKMIKNLRESNDSEKGLDYFSMKKRKESNSVEVQ